MNNQFIVTGIGTGIGKTVVSAVLAEALGATYWKPVQAGDLENSDSIKVRKWCTEAVRILPEAFRLSKPMSPHAAAEIDGLFITAEQTALPRVEGNLIVEGAGGLMVPVNHHCLLFIDLIKEWNLPVILVSRNYLGSINHTLLSSEMLKYRNIDVAGIVFVGDENKATENIILQQTELPFLLRIPDTELVDRTFIQDQALALKENIHALNNARPV